MSKSNKVFKIVFLVVFIVTSFCCVFLYSQGGDMKITIRHGMNIFESWQNGKGLNFYTYCYEKITNGAYADVYGNVVRGILPNYNYFIYVFVGIINLPVLLISKLCGMDTYNEQVAVAWLSVILMALCILGAILLYKLSLELGMKDRQAKWSGILFVTSIILLFGIVGYSQLDIIIVDLVLWALIYYKRDKMYTFSLIMSLTIMLKSMPLMIFIPLLLIVEKRPLHIIKYVLIGLSGTILFKLVVHFDYYYSLIEEIYKQDYFFVDRLFASGIEVGFASISLFILGYIILCIYCFDYKSTKERWKFVIIIPVAVYTLFVCFVMWHPNWLAMITPFMALALVVNPSRRSNIWLEWIAGIAFLGVMFTHLYVITNNLLINESIVTAILGTTYGGQDLGSAIINRVPNAKVLFMTMLAAVLIYYTVANSRDILKMKSIDSNWNLPDNEFSKEGFNWSKTISIIRPATLIVATLGMWIFAYVKSM